MRGRGSSDRAGGARRGPSCWLARRSVRNGATQLRANCEWRDRQLDYSESARGRRVRNGPRRACAGRAVKRHFGGSAFCWSQPVLHLAALREWNVTLATGELMQLISHRLHNPPNVLTLSCKSRLTCLLRRAARRLPRPTPSGRSELQPTWRGRAVGAARGGSAAGPADRRLLSACEGS